MKSRNSKQQEKCFDCEAGEQDTKLGDNLFCKVP